MDQEQMKQALKEAGCYEENLTKEEIKSYYEAIADSKELSINKEEQRMISNRARKKLLSNLPLIDVKEPSKLQISFDDMLKSHLEYKDDLPFIINYDNKYVNVNNTDKFVHNSESNERALILYQYRKHLVQKIVKQSNYSFNKPKLSHSITLEFKNDDLKADLDDKSTYISRSGRLTKRKMYNEFDFDDDFTSNDLKKLKQGKQDYSKKKSNHKSRSEILFENCVKDLNKKKKDELSMKKLTESVEMSDSNDDYDIKDDDFNNFNLSNTKSNKTTFDLIEEMHKSTPNKENYNISTNNNKKIEEFIKDCNKIEVDNGDGDNAGVSGYSRIDKASSEMNSVSSRKASCPICGKEFSKVYIEEHASTCGEEVISSPKLRSHSTQSNLTCPSCDKVFFQDYEEHVKECDYQRK